MIDDTSVFTRFKGSDCARLCLEALTNQRITRGNVAIAKALHKKHELQFHRNGDIIIKQGDGTNNLILILAGKVAVVRNNREIAHRAAGESVGEMAVIDVQQRRCASIIAKEDCVVGSVPESDFAILARKYPELWRSLAKQVADRLRQRLEGVRHRNNVPRLFIGSSTESKKVAMAVKKAMDRVAETIMWTQGNVFEPGKSTLESLEEQARRSDFAVMVFAPDDVIFYRGKRHVGPRDNVIFELGLFMGALDRKRAFVVAPRGKKLKIPTDILGTNFVTYSGGVGRSLEQSIDNACETMRGVIFENGPL